MTLPAYLQQASKEYKWRKLRAKVDEEDTSDPIAWIQTHFYIPETGKSIELYPSQVEPLREALATDDGLFRYSTIDWSVIKKSAKSCIAAAVGLWMCRRKDWSSAKSSPTI